MGQRFVLAPGGGGRKIPPHFQSRKKQDADPLRECKGPYKAFIHFVKDLDEKLKCSDRAAIFEVGTFLRELGGKKVQFIESVRKFDNSMKAISRARKAIYSPEIVVSQLVDCVNNLEGVLYSLQRKRAFILLKAFGIDGLSDTKNADDHLIACRYLGIGSEEKDEAVKMARVLGEEIKLTEGGLVIVTRDRLGKDTFKELTPEETKKTSVFMDEGYKWYLQKRLKLNDEQVEIECNKFDGKSFDQWVREIQSKLKPPLEDSYLRGPVMAKIALAETRTVTPYRNGERTEEPHVNGNGNGVAAHVKISPRESQKLTEEEKRDLIASSYEDLIHYPNPRAGYEDFLDRLLLVLNKQRAFKELNLTVNDLREEISKNLGLSEDHFQVILAHRELTKTERVIEREDLAVRTGIDLKILDGVIDIINSSGVYNVELNTPPVVAVDLMNDPRTVTVIGLEIPIFNELKVDYGFDNARFPSSHEASNGVDDIKWSNSDRERKYHTNYQGFRHRHLLDVKLLLKEPLLDGKKVLSERIPTAVCGRIWRELKESGEARFIPGQNYRG